MKNKTKSDILKYVNRGVITLATLVALKGCGNVLKSTGYVDSSESPYIKQQIVQKYESKYTKKSYPSSGGAYL